jgi:epoxyqueuosine reductase
MASPLHEQVRAGLRGLGFDEVRFAALPDADVGAGLGAWFDAGHHADMAWMERTRDKRADPTQVLPGARSIILLGVNYWMPDAPLAARVGATGAGQPEGHGASEAAAGAPIAASVPAALASATPRWARYALHADYHDTIRTGLEEAGRLLERLAGIGSEDYRYYVDTGPVLERGWAARSGLGFTGKNAMLISRTHGNWLFLASILTRLALPADPPIRRRPPPPSPAEPGAHAGLLCGKCTRCLDACPTQAFPSPGVVDSRRCVSYHTIENKGIIPRALRRGIGDRVYGCDTCLEVCPWNRFAQEGRRLLLSVRHDLRELTLAELLALTPERFAAVFRGTAVKRLKLSGLLRNACIVAGNSGDPAHLPALQSLAQHPLAVVRAHAVWAVFRLGGGAALAAARAAETDPLVLAEYAAEESREDAG